VFGRIKERFELDEDDYDLLEEANVTGFHRPANLVRWAPSIFARRVESG